MNTPFSLANDSDYRVWRAAKLANYPRRVDDLIVSIDDPRALQTAEICCARANMVLYHAPDVPAVDKNVPHQFAKQLGLVHLEGNYLADEDGLSSITPTSDKEHIRSEYVPYTHKPINWHTDGYYNAPDRRILGMLLHCVRDADSGGENALLDPDIAYIQLREMNPDYVAALMQPDAMTIPARMDEANIARAEQSGPVFSIDANEGFLHMRYTARTRSIEWKQDAITQAAVNTLAEILNDSEYVLRIRLKPGMGIICNNVLHTRTAFVDQPTRRRLLYRGRYYDRLNFAALAG
jgi:alpha-ketoglutarate-dependent taurine dioxygenase